MILVNLMVDLVFVLQMGCGGDRAIQFMMVDIGGTIFRIQLSLEKRWPGSDGYITSEECLFLDKLAPEPSWWKKARGKF